MPEFEVTIVETLTKSVSLEAEDEGEAFWQVCKGWKNEDYILYPEDFLDVEFEVKADGYITIYDVKGNLRKCMSCGD